MRVIARAPVPVVGCERYARRLPDRDLIAEVSPLVACVPPREPARRGPLDGDVIIKDQIDVAGCPTAQGTAGACAVAARDATIVARIAAAGGRIVGKAKMTELG